MSTFKNKNSLRTIEAQIVQKRKNNEVRPKFTGSYFLKKVCMSMKKWVLPEITIRAIRARQPELCFDYICFDRYVREY